MVSVCTHFIGANATIDLMDRLVNPFKGRIQEQIDPASPIKTNSSDHVKKKVIDICNVVDVFNND